MKKIELSEDEIKVIRQQLNHEIEVWSATEYQKKHLTSVIDKADALMDELHEDDALIDDYNADLIYWFWCKYKQQEGIEE